MIKRALPTISEQAERIREVLATWAEERGGTAKVMANMAHLWEEIYAADEKPKILITWNGEVSRGGFNQANLLHRVDRKWVVVVMRAHGFKSAVSEPGPTAGTATPFWDNIELIREELRKMQDISEEFPIDYSGTSPLPNLAPGRGGNVFLDADKIEFSTANDIPEITSS